MLDKDLPEDFKELIGLLRCVMCIQARFEAILKKDDERARKRAELKESSVKKPEEPKKKRKKIVGTLSLQEYLEIEDHPNYR